MYLARLIKKIAYNSNYKGKKKSKLLVAIWADQLII